MREINLSKYNIRTDLIIDNFIDDNEVKNLDYYKEEIEKDIIYEKINISENDSKIINKTPGNYRCISFKDITDHDNYDRVLKTFIRVFKSFLDDKKLDISKKCMIVGLGNRNSTPDAIGPKVLDNITVTHHLLEYGPLEDGYRDIMTLEPSVTGSTGIDAKDHILGLTNILNPDFLIVIDALKTNSTDRIIKTIQISDTGIIPGSGVNNNRKEISNNELNIPIITIGIPTIIDSVTIVYDTLNYLLKKISYEKNNSDNYKNKIAITNSYKNYNNDLTLEEKEKILGLIGTLDEYELKKLLNEVLNPLDYNLMVTPKEIDFLVDKISLLISIGLNNSLNIINDKKII